jgi:hypothetical protein
MRMAKCFTNSSKRFPCSRMNTCPAPDGTMFAPAQRLPTCSLVEVYRRFRDACCLHHQGDEYPVDGSKHP